MKGGTAQEFLDHATYEEVAVIYQGVKYFFHGLVTSDNGQYSFVIDIWDHNNEFVETVFSDTFSSKDGCITAFENSKIFDGKAFWEAESKMEWVEW